MAEQPMRSPLGRAIGLGSAKEGVGHWWAQRLTAVALVPLVVWFVVTIIMLAGASRATLVAWVHHPVPATVWVLLLLVLFYHSALGLQVVIEDYVENEAAKLTLLILNRLGNTLLAVLAVVAVVKLSLGT
jgi:succinate dehydrogenase membrane anchor subunit